MDKPKVLIIGLDCFDPGLIFDQWKKYLPNISKLIRNGISGRLRSTDPPITVPAWTSMFTGKDPGELGIYGFRNRESFQYNSLKIANSTAISFPRIWDMISEYDKSSIILGVPQTYPPSPLNGVMVSGFLAPAIENNITWPADFKSELLNVAPEYALDVENFRGEDKGNLIKQIYKMTDQRFKLLSHCLCKKPWDLGIMVEIGVDRMHHAFWGYMDKDNDHYNPGGEYENVIFEYYQYLDQQIGMIVNEIPEETIVMIVSDDGAKNLMGGFCINEWLIRDGYLNVKEYPNHPVPLDIDNVDWSKTRVWGEGGYYARCMLNINNREPNGIIDPINYVAEINGLKDKLSNVNVTEDFIIENQVYQPQDLYSEVTKIAPDLFVYFDQLNYRSVGGIGYNQVIINKNDTGSDHANHDFYGVLILNGPGVTTNQFKEISIYDIVPTILDLFNIGGQDNFHGQSIIGSVKSSIKK